jgi:metal-sulfur cluster biosynthetic enzyme
MAIYHLSVKIIGRSSGRSAVGAAAYRSAQKLVNERDGITHDYNRKGGIVEEGSFILAPEHAPGWTKDRGQLWNEVEKVEKQKDAQLSREFEIALPAELTREQQIDLGRDFAQELVKMGMVVDGNLHDKNDGNPHYHFMATMRPFNSDGSGWGAKCRKEYMLNKEGEKIRLKSGQWKSRKISTTDWDTPETLEKWRKTWATIGNKHLEAAGHEPTLDHRSNADRGIEELPTVHLGVESHAMEKRGIQTELGNINRERTEYNKALNLKTEDITEKINQLEVLAIEAIPFYKPGHKEWKKAVENLMTDVVQPEPAVKPIFDRGEVFKAKEIGKVAEVKKEQQEAVAMTTTHPVSEWTGIIKNNKEKYKKQATQLENTRVLLNNQLQNSYALFFKTSGGKLFC